MIAQRPFALLVVLQVSLLFAPRTSAHEPVQQSRTVPPRVVGFEERVEAQRAVEEVFWRHRLWPTENPGPKPPLSAVVPYEALRGRVDDALRKSAALEILWHRPITNEQLQAEIERMTKNSRDPGMLRELFAALEDDANRIAEALARPALVERLVRSSYSSDGRFHGALRRQAEEGIARAAANPAAMKLVGGEYFETTWKRSAGSDDLPEIPGTKRTLRIPSNSWNERLAGLTALFATAEAAIPLLRVSPIVEDDESFHATAVLTRTEDSVTTATVSWRKIPFDTWWAETRSGIRADLPAPSGPFSVALSPTGTPCNGGEWTSITEETLPFVPSLRSEHTAVWTGTEMIVWGGSAGAYLNTGARYNPATDSWTPIATGPIVPAPRKNHTAVWTGTSMVVWGGIGPRIGFNTGGRYDPVTDSWLPTQTNLAPSARFGHTTVWTGGEMIVWGGHTLNPDGSYGPSLATGARYAPASDTWIPTLIQSVPDGRSSHSAVWTGTEMIVWGGYSSTFGNLSSGGRYNPVTDVWQPTAVGPSARVAHSAVWSGSQMIVWGGVHQSVYLIDGGRYDPATNSWALTSTSSAPAGSQMHTAVWTGTQMIVWGGFGSGSQLNAGGRYDPAADAWVPTSFTNAPTGRYLHTAVWTGTEMILWGGWGSTLSSNGARYSPATDAWIPTVPASTGGATPRYAHTAVWTGSEMIVWGGNGFGSAYPDSGGRYRPATDDWLATPIGPAGRDGCVAVWTGTEMIVWGGENATGYLSDGSRYNPLTNQWSPFNGILGRTDATAVWTGTQMLVWGGFHNPYVFGAGCHRNDGGSYNPGMSSMAAIATPTLSARSGHGAVWTGNEMIVWGGHSNWFGCNEGGYLPDDGGHYAPSTNTWSVFASWGVAAGRARSVWSGTEMIAWWDLPSYYPNPPMHACRRYDPSTNSWSGSCIGSAPSLPNDSTVVWAGDRMIVWGGSLQNLGGEYVPSSNLWFPTSILGNVPTGRDSHTAVWTGTEMIVWGGIDNSQGVTNTGATYCPCTNTTFAYRDEDLDGIGSSVLTSTCDGAFPPGSSSNTGDCNDLNPSIHPGAAEICNGVDENCNGEADEWFDTDLDGFTQCGGDCDDGNGSVYPGAALLCNGINEDCSDPLWPAVPANEVDADGDEYRICQGDCDDSSASMHPLAVETCNGIDDDCDATIDEDQQGVDSDRDGVHNACDDCPFAYNPGQHDLDGDQQGDLCDLDDGAIFMLYADGPDYIEWQEEAGFTSWNVYEGDLDVLQGTGVYSQIPGSNPLAQRQCGVTVPWVEDFNHPPAQKTRFSLVTGVYDGVEGSLGRDGQGAVRPNANPCP